MVVGMSSSTRMLKEKVRSDYLSTDRLGLGARLPTIRDLALEYKVSPPTMGRAVELLAAEGWINKCRGGGIRVARLPGTGSSQMSSGAHRIGYLVPWGMTSPILEGVSEVVEAREGILEVAKSNWSFEEERRQVESMIKRGVRGIVLYPTPFRPKSEEYLGQELRDFPIVTIGLYQSEMKRSHVVFDHFSAGRDMTRYLLAMKRKEIAFLKFEDEISFPSVDECLGGYRRGLQEAHETFVPERVISFEAKNEYLNGSFLKGFDLQYKNFFTALDRAMVLSPRPRALIVPSDWFAFIAIKYLRKCGISVPGDVVVAGFDNHSIRQSECWPTTNPDHFRMGEKAAELLFDQMNSQQSEVSGLILSCPLLTSEQESPGFSGWHGETHPLFNPARISQDQCVLTGVTG
jgi:DNA-binding LacI/PurR family transcriptional regulator